jgi:hypothetical protein
MSDLEENECQFFGLGVFNMSSENAFVDEGFGEAAIGHDGIGAASPRRSSPSLERARSSHALTLAEVNQEHTVYLVEVEDEDELARPFHHHEEL